MEENIYCGWPESKIPVNHLISDNVYCGWLESKIPVSPFYFRNV